MPGTITITRPILFNFRVSADEKRAIQSWAARGSQTASDAARTVVLGAAQGTAATNGR
mgnify:CR=1 FL=1